MEEDRILIQGVLDRKEDAINKLIGLLYEISESIINFSFDSCINKSSLKKELADELYIHIMDNPEILQNFQGGCRLRTYLSSIGKHFFSCNRFDTDPAILEAKKDKKKIVGKDARKIIKMGDEPLLFEVNRQTPIPTEFRDESEEFFDDDLFSETDDEKDVIVDVDKIVNTSEVVYTDKCKLVRHILDQMPPRQALLYQLQYFEGIEDSRELANRLGITIAAFYNLRRAARKTFIDCFNQLKKQQYEKN